MIQVGPPPTPDKLWRLSEIAAAFGRPVYDLRVLVYFGDLQAMIIGDEVYIRDTDLVAFANEHLGGEL